MLVLLGVIALVVGILASMRRAGDLSSAGLRQPGTVFVVMVQAFVLAIQIGFLALRALQRTPQPYSDFISGEVGFANQNKVAEYYAVYAAVLSFFLLLMLIAKLHRSLLDSGIQARRGIHNLSLYALIPSAILAGQALRVPNVQMLLALSSFAILLSLAVAAIICLLVRQHIIHSGLLFETGSKLMLGISMLALSDIGVAVALSRAKITSYHVGTLSLAVVFACFAYILLRGRWRPVPFKTVLNAGFYLSQAGVPLLFTVLASPPVLLQNGAIGAFRYTPSLYILILVLVAIALADTYRRFRRSESRGSAPSVDVSPFVLIAILIYLHSSPLGWPSVWADDYHAGEAYLPWWLLDAHGYLPYADYQPSRGIINYIPGFLSWLFFDNTASGQSMIGSLEAALYLSIAFCSLRMAVGDLVAFLVAASLSMITNGPLAGVLVAVCGLAVLHHVASKGPLIRTLWLWMGLCLLLPLFAIAEGSVFIIAAMPVGIVTVLQALRTPRARPRLAVSIAIVIISGALLALATPVWRIGFAAARYLLEQASVNDVAHGVPWMYPEGISERVTAGSLWQFVRFSWLLLVVPIGIELLRGGRRSVGFLGSNLHRWLLLVSLLVMAVALVPRAAGRIGADAYSRPGWASVAMVCCGLPLILFPGAGTSRKRVSLLLLSTLVFGVLGDQATTLRTAAGLHRHVIREPDGLISGEDVGLVYIGSSVSMNPESLKRKILINKVLTRLLDARETYYDATNHNADYAFQGMPPPVSDTAFHNVPSMARQKTVLSQLESAKPPLVLLEAENIIFTGATLPMRAYWIYDYLLAEYTPFADEHGRIWMIRHGEEDRLSGTPYSLGTIAEQAALLQNALVRRNLGGWPASWGRSLGSLASALGPPIDLLASGGLRVTHDLKPSGEASWIVTGPKPILVLDIPAGGKGDMLYISTVRDVQGSPLELFWANNLVPKFASAHSFRFDAGSSTYLVPLSAAPSWALADDLYQLRIDLPEGTTQEVQFIALSLHSRVGP
jgi:hypothetical protein